MGAHEPAAGEGTAKGTAPEQGHRAIEERIRLAEQTARFGTWAWDPVSQLFALSEGAAVLSGLGNQPVEVTGAELYAICPPRRWRCGQGRS